ncbi:ribonuclease Y [Carnobacteriaceae bacterium zg-84]|uniref:ribonuclease Y n=1 Tax=Granulicatella sp. zg-84 TaxID=2678503 RepID=UPI0013C01189|nr:ribonuclease Y [Granulicatella sp. zg-84]NEW65402.1 ribonuclease Y [Granulicatella sp. zg-84]QMI85202.1 ribonuclease Y [Carnobacteriaceae bacterium zg-84]
MGPSGLIPQGDATSTIIVILVAAILGIGAGYIFRKLSYEKKLASTRGTVEFLLEDAKKNADLTLKDAESEKKALLLGAKEEIQQYRTSIDQELKERRNDVIEQEKRLVQRETNLDRKDENLSRREQTIDDKEKVLSQRSEVLSQEQLKIESLIAQQQQELENIASLTSDEAKEIILTKLTEELKHERAVLVKESQRQAEETADRQAKNIILQAIQRTASDLVSENTVSVISLPNEEMKGRIIGREGRNIRTLETLTGIDVIIDDTPEAVVLSGFDPVRREIAKMTLEKLMKDGRIHPARIEEMVEKSRKEMDERIRDIGEKAVFDVGVHTLHPDLIKILGRLYFRTSYGQNVLNHSIEVARLSGIIAGELGENVNLAKRAGLLHDLGKALDHEVEGSHVEIGAEFAQKYKENPIVVNAIASHHGDVEATSVIAVIVAIADALSAARPGARSDSLENYIKRLEKLEEISNSFEGIDKSFAIQAGREVRVMVKPDVLDDDQTALLARDIKEKIESELEYPGHIKVTVIRELRSVEYAK